MMKKNLKTTLLLLAMGATLMGASCGLLVKPSDSTSGSGGDGSGSYSSSASLDGDSSSSVSDGGDSSSSGTTVKSIRISFVAEGTAVDSVTTDNDKTVVLPTAPEKTGYTFVSWTIQGTNTEFTADYLTKNAIENDLTISANYSANTYQLSFAGAETDVAAITVTYDAKLDLPEVPEKAGYTGVWQIDGKKVTKADVWNFTENKTAQAVYTAQEVGYSVKVYEKSDIGAEYTDVTMNYLDYIGDLTGKTGETADITAVVAEMQPEKYDLAQTSVLTGTIFADGSLELSVYFDVKVLTVSYYIGDDLHTTEQVVYGKDAIAALPETANGMEYLGWIGADMQTATLSEITENVNVYAWYKIVAAVGDKVAVKLPSVIENAELRSADTTVVTYDAESGKATMNKLGCTSIGVYVSDADEAIANISVEIKTTSIATAAELMAIQDTLDQNYTYILANDIDLTVDSEGYTVTTKFSWGAGEHHDAPAAKEFKGHIKGNGYTVKMTISEGIVHPQDNRNVFDMALIHKMSGGSIEDVCFEMNFTNANADQTALIMQNYGTVKNVLYKATYAGLSDWNTCHNAMVWNNYGYVENCVAIHDVGGLTRNNDSKRGVNVVGAQQGLLNDLSTHGWAGMSNCVNIVVNNGSYNGTYNYVGANDGYGTFNNVAYTMTEFAASDFAFDSANGWSKYWNRYAGEILFGNKCIRISTAAEFMAIQNTLDQDYTYILANDIDLTVASEGYTVTTKFSWGAGEHHDAPAAKEFKGHIKGNGYTVKMTISEGIVHPQDNRNIFDMALIHKMSGGSIEDVCFEMNFTNASANQTALIMNNFGTVKNVLYKATYAGLSGWGVSHNAMVACNYGYVENCVAIHDVGSLTNNNDSNKGVNVVGAQQGLLNDLSTHGWAGMSNCVNIVVNNGSYNGTYNCVGANDGYGTFNNVAYTMTEFVASDFAFDSANGWNSLWKKSANGITFGNVSVATVSDPYDEGVIIGG